MARSVAARQRIGTVAVTAVGMFAGGGAFGLTPPVLMSLQVVVGGMTQRPRAVRGRVEVRTVGDRPPPGIRRAIPPCDGRGPRWLWPLPIRTGAVHAPTLVPVLAGRLALHPPGKQREHQQ